MGLKVFGTLLISPILTISNELASDWQFFVIAVHVVMLVLYKVYIGLLKLYIYIKTVSEFNQP